MAAAADGESVPIPAVAPNGAVRLPRVTLSDALGSILRSLHPSCEEQDGSRSGGSLA
jgi:hypothetical protein